MRLANFSDKHKFSGKMSDIFLDDSHRFRKEYVMAEKILSSQSADVLQDEVRRLRRAVEELSILNDIARAISASLNAEEIMQTLIRKSLRAVNAEQGVITLVEDEQKSMKTLIRTMVSSAGAPAFHMHQALIGWMHLNKKPLSVDDPANDARFRECSGTTISKRSCVFR